MQKKVSDFEEKKSILPKIIVIYGPTASGKTALSIEVAKALGSEIISTDSRQIFKFLNIGTGKITEEEKEGVVHHMIDIIDPNQTYSVWEFKAKVTGIIEAIHKKWKIPILCGGTGLYLDSVIYDFDIPKIPANLVLRSNLEKEAKDFWNVYVFEKLQKIDPEYAQELHPNNLKYVIRGLEVKILTWKSKKDFREEKVLCYDTLFLTPYQWDRLTLYNNIDKRVQMMFDAWLVSEVQWLLQKGYKKTDFWLQTIGYTEVCDYLEWKMTLEKTIEMVQQHSRNYAKRQLTWFQRYEKPLLLYNEAWRTPLFTQSRILFLIGVFFVFSLPLVYRYLSFLLK